MENDSCDRELEKALNHQLNKNGYCFQYSVLKEIQQSIKDSNSPWLFEVAEFPVSINDENTHIDFILQNKHEPFYLICECKRVDPALSNWVFIKTPAVNKNVLHNNENIVREIVNERGDQAHLQFLENHQTKYRLAFELKSKEKGDGGYGKGQIDNSISQVIRGFNGFIEYTIKRIKTAGFQSNRGNKRIAFMPVIFTTAKIMTSEVDISESNLLTGNIDIDKISLVEKEWCFFQYNQSPNLKHNYYTLFALRDLSEIMTHEFIRTIPIVNAKGIRNFLSFAMWNDVNLFKWSSL